MMEKIIITGATGILGRILVEHLNKFNIELILVGRNHHTLKNDFPKFTSCSYVDLEKTGQGASTIIHLAVANNNQNLTESEYMQANVTLLNEILNIASKISIKKIINLTTFHVFFDKKNGYTQSKLVALEALKMTKNLIIVNIFSPAMYGNKFKGKLRIFNSLPVYVRHTAFKFISAFEPVVHLSQVVETIKAEVFSFNTFSRDVYVADEKNDNLTFNYFKIFSDIGFSVVVLVIFWWLLLAIWIAVKLSSNGPGLFAQIRIGKDRVPFTCYKFRTMDIKTKNVGTHEVDSNLVTTFGKFLRKTKLDELPQIINLLRGELSLVGPRPGLPNQKELYNERYSRGIFNMKPGITGYAQVNDIDMSNPKNLVDWDERYMALRSINLEFKILLQTFIGRGQGDKLKYNKK